MTPDPAPTLRDHLREQPPQDFKVKAGWRALIQALRLRRRLGGPASAFASQQAVDRALSRPLLAPDVADLSAVKSGLKALLLSDLDEEARCAQAQAVDAALERLLPQEAQEPLWVAVTGWPTGVNAATRARIVGVDPPLPGPLPPLAAARLRHRLHGLVLAGFTLQVEVALPDGQVLPALPREARADTGRWGRAAPWLPHLDEEGRYSLTPRPIAEAQARRLKGQAGVIDLFCGCGGNALAFVLAGLPVVAVDRDAGRLDLARRNAAALKIPTPPSFCLGRAEDVLPGLIAAHPDWVLFVDPPWGGPGELAPDLDALLPDTGLRALILSHPRLMMKLPRAFDLRALPPRAGGFTLRLELGEDEGGDGQTVRMLTVSAGLGG